MLLHFGFSIPPFVVSNGVSIFLHHSGLVVGDSCSVCQVEAQGVYPTMQVTDARSSGSVEALSKLYLWKLFSLDALNTYLFSEPDPSELTHRVPTRHR